MQNNKVVNILDRSVVKHNGVVLYTLLSSNETDTYFATYINGQAECECKGFEYRKTCRHSVAINALEASRINDEKLEVYRASLYGISEREAAETARCYRDIAFDDRF